MIKKTAITLGLVALAGFFVFGREFSSYLKTGAKSVRQAVRAEVPVEFELERARQLIGELVPEIRQAMHVVAEQQVELNGIQSRVARKEHELQQQEQTLLSLRSRLNGAQPVVFVGGRRYSQADVERDLSVRLARFEANETSLSNERKILAAKTQVLTANRDKLDQLMQSRKELEVKLEQLAARLQTVQAAEQIQASSLDESRWTKARQLVTQLNQELDVREQLLDTEKQYVGLIPVESDDARPLDADSIAARIDAKFGLGAKASDVAQASAVQPENE